MTIYSLSGLVVVLLMWVAAWNLRAVKARQTLLLLASYFFYANWGLGFLSILIASSLVNFFIGSLLRRRQGLGYLWLGVAFNILLLGFFKYLPRVLEAGEPGSWQFDFARHIIMPVGMSFWTLQGLSYLIDIYLDEDVGPSLLEFCLYMAFWPTVLSGPVCRLPAMLPQFRKTPVFSGSDISAGALYLVQGVFMKMYLAQLLLSGWTKGGGVAAGFDLVRSGWGGIDVWLLGIGFGFQLFFDFAGYSLIAIGVARVFGIRVAPNFDRPFLSTTPAIFWTRWHMSVSFWIRDYLYTPLAFARRDRWWPYIVLVITMTVFGLWHEAKWTFVVFGAYHGVLLVLHRLGRLLKQRVPFRAPQYAGQFLAWGATFLLVSVGYVLFRANDLSQAFSMLGSLLSPNAYWQFAMPRSFYLLIVAVGGGYFGTIAGYSLLSSWRVRYRQNMKDPTETADSRWSAGLSNVPLMIGAVVDFLAVRLWWWFAPAVVSLAVLVGVAIYTQSAVVSVTPFIYTLF